MARKNIILASVILLLVIGASAGFYLYSQSSDDYSSNVVDQTADNTRQVAENSPQNDNSKQTKGKYLDYENGAIEKTSGTKILFFHAPWCSQCRALEEDILSKGVPDGVTIFKVDYDSSQKLRQKYGVTIQTTMVKVDDQGNEIGKFVAYEEPTLDSVENNLL